MPLEYATSKTDARVRYTRDADRATIVIHRPERRAKAAANSTGELVGELWLYVIIAGVVVAFAKPFWLLLLIPGAAVLTGRVAYWRLSQPAVIEVTMSDVIFSNLDPGPPRAFPQERIDAIEYIVRSRKLTVRAKGFELFEHRFSLPGEKVEEIAAFLRSVCSLSTESKAANE
jgi:hypothetical protein